MKESSRRLRRLYSDQDLSSCDQILLSSEESRHASKSLRLEIGDSCLLADGRGNEAEARLEAFEKDRALFKILSRAEARRGFQVPVTVLPALIKKGKMDGLVEKAQEFGAAVFQPLVCEYSEFEIDAERFQAVAARWQKIAKEAAKQSGSSVMLDIREPLKFEKAMAALEQDALVLVFHTHEPARDWTRLAPEVTAKKKQYAKVYVLTGPEGGFSPHEIEMAMNLKNPNLYFVSMGSTVLKADTAFIAALAGVSFFL